MVELKISPADYTALAKGITEVCPSKRCEGLATRLKARAKKLANANDVDHIKIEKLVKRRQKTHGKGYSRGRR